MSDIYQIANVAMLEGKQRLQAISLNAASASLTGYRRHVVAGPTFDAALAAVPAAASPVEGYQVDLQRGAPIATGRALDLAIDAEDLFFALTDGTQTWLTRAGSFRVNEDGVLVGEGGRHVLGAQGDIHLPSSDVIVNAQGQVTYQGVIVAALQLYRANDPQSLRAADGSLLLSPTGITPAESGTTRLRSGELEASNTDAAREMLGLMTLSRQFESLSHVLQGYDELLGRAIQKLSEG